MIYSQMLANRLTRMKEYFEAGAIAELKIATDNLDIALIPVPEIQKQYIDYMISKKKALDSSLKALETSIKDDDKDLLEPMILQLMGNYYHDIIVQLENMLNE